MNAVAVRASNLILTMQAVSPARMRLCAGVASETFSVHLFYGQTPKGKDLCSIAGVHVGFTRSVARFATLILPAFGTASFQNLVRILGEGIGQVFVARGAGRRSHIMIPGRHQLGLWFGSWVLRATIFAFRHESQANQAGEQKREEASERSSVHFGGNDMPFVATTNSFFNSSWVCPYRTEKPTVRKAFAVSTQTGGLDGLPVTNASPERLLGP